MRFCNNCGAQVDENTKICGNCGHVLHATGFNETSFNNNEGFGSTRFNNVTDQPNIILNIIAFLIPIVGLVMYIIYHTKYPIKASSIAKWALIGFILGVIWSILGSILSFSLGILGL